MKYILIYECLQLNKDISYDYYNSVKKNLIIKILIFVLPMLFAITFISSKSYADHTNPQIQVSPSTTLSPFQDFSVNISNCPAGDEIWVGLFEDGAHTSVTRKTVTRQNDGTAVADFTTGSKIDQSYTVRVTCDGHDTNFPSAFRTEQFNGTITLRHEQTQPNSARVIAEGCPPNGETKFEYKLYPAVVFRVFDDTSDASGVSSFSLNAAGDYVVKISCGGITSSEYAFTITEDGSQGAVFPTLPPPPEPPCGQMVNGKCLNIDTPIGNISTDGIGIIYNLFTIILSLSGGILVLIIIYAGYLLMMSRGNPEQIQKAREILVAAIVGFLFIIFSYVIFGTLTDDILNLPGFRAEDCLPNDASCIP